MAHKHSWRKVYEHIDGLVSECVGCKAVKGPPDAMSVYMRMRDRGERPVPIMADVATIRQESAVWEPEWTQDR